MAAIIGIESRFSADPDLSGLSRDLVIVATYGHVAFEDDSGQIFGFSPDPMPEPLEVRMTYSGSYTNQTDLFMRLRNRVKIERFSFGMSWFDQAYMHVRLQSYVKNEYCVRAPIRGPPYNCISYLREVVGVGDLPQTNFLGELFGILREREVREKILKNRTRGD